MTRKRRKDMGMMKGGKKQEAWVNHFVKQFSHIHSPEGVV
jgi:hypothetical protein